MKTHSSRRIVCWLTGLVIAASFAGTASAGPIWSEGAVDAGDLPGTAEVTVGVGPLESIQGHLLGIDDIDLFAIRITDPAGFSATTVSPNTEFLDTQLFLFDADGFGVVANDDTEDFEFNATIPAGEVAAAGLYYVGVSELGDDPVSLTGLIFPVRGFVDPPLFTDVVGPTGPGGANPLVAWNVDGFSESIFPPFSTSYEIVLTGATFAAVPEPTSFALFAAGSLIALGVQRRRRQRRARL